MTTHDLIKALLLKDLITFAASLAFGALLFMVAWFIITGEEKRRAELRKARRTEAKDDCEESK